MLLVVLTMADIILQTGHIERIFVEVPVGATWAEATMKASGFDTSRRFSIDTLQVHDSPRKFLPL